MYRESLDFKQNIHLLGVSYISNFLDRIGYTILEVNTDPHHHYQLFVKINDKSLLIAIRTGYHPKWGTLYNCTAENLLREAEMLDAIPHFAGLKVLPADRNDKEVDSSSEGLPLRIVFNGISAIRKSKISPIGVAHHLKRNGNPGRSNVYTS